MVALAGNVIIIWSILENSWKLEIVRSNQTIVWNKKNMKKLNHIIVPVRLGPPFNVLFFKYLRGCFLLPPAQGKRFWFKKSLKPFQPLIQLCVYFLFFE